MRCALVTLFVLVSSVSASAQSASNPFVDNPVPDLLSALMTMSLADEISGSHYVIDNGNEISDDTKLSTLHIPFNGEFGVEMPVGNLRWRSAVGFLFARDHLNFPTDSGTSDIKEDWRAVSAYFGVGWALPMGDRWRAVPGCGLGLSYLENASDYNAVAEVDVAPRTEGVLFNWSAYTALIDASLTIERPRDPDVLSLGLHARYEWTGTNVFGATSSFQEGGDHSRFLLFRSEVGGPTPWVFHDRPVSWEVFGAWLGMYDIQRESLGFDQFFEVGAALDARVLPEFPSIHLSGSFIGGPDVRGWSAGLSLAF